jgi:hypothetical protein
MIHLVLEKAGLKAVESELDRMALLVLGLDHDPLRPRHVRLHPGEGKTPLGLHHQFLGALFDLGVEEHPLLGVEADQDHPSRHSYLGGGEPQRRRWVEHLPQVAGRLPGLGPSGLDRPGSSAQN